MGGIRQSGARREDIFVTVKLGYAGPMGGTKTQSLAVLRHLKLDYADLCLIHLPEVGPGTGSHGEYGPDHCVPGGVWKPGSNDTYNPALCRVTTYRNLVKDFEAGRCKAIGVNNWNVSDFLHKTEESTRIKVLCGPEHKSSIHLPARALQ